MLSKRKRKMKTAAIHNRALSLQKSSQHAKSNVKKKPARPPFKHSSVRVCFTKQVTLKPSPVGIYLPTALRYCVCVRAYAPVAQQAPHGPIMTERDLQHRWWVCICPRREGGWCWPQRTSPARGTLPDWTQCIGDIKIIHRGDGLNHTMWVRSNQTMLRRKIVACWGDKIISYVEEIKSYCIMLMIKSYITLRR